ncbi:MAG TPA: hypothetical protein DCE41_06170 [Cytophagales bacterium]|nr:hypothetical protein [Cytophagales bacterium]HAA21380.1 hypothetical protein [Cytophagales bacterium]HAP59450.1 hypothetical protein [Cytophagales bacterium]
MMNLLKLEFRKLKGYRPFWVLLILHYGFLFIGMASLSGILSQIEFSGQGFSFTKRALYAFPDVWQNLGFTAKWFASFLGILVINSLTNEYSYRTNRQNIIDGLSRTQFVTSKVLLVFTMALLGTVFLWLAGTILGATNSSFKGYFTGWSFLGGYFVSVAGFYMFCLFIGILVRRAAPAILVLLGYATIMQGLYRWKLPEPLLSYRPLKAFGSLVQEPFRRYIPLDTDAMFGELVDYVPLDSLVASLVWLGVFMGACYYIENRRDL